MKNKMITLLIATVLFFSVLSISLGTERAAAASGEGIVTVSSLHLRETSSTKSKSLTFLLKGTKVQIKSIKNSWMQVYVPSKKKTGWVAKKYISTSTIAPAKTTSTTTTYYVKAESLKVMASSSRQAKVLTTIKKGTSVTYLSQKTSWGQIKTSYGITGWVANRDLSTTKPEGTNNTESKAETTSNNQSVRYVNVDTLHVMASSSRQAKVLTTIKKGASVTYLSQKTSWGQIKTSNGITGWIANRDLSMTKPVVLTDEIKYVTSDTLNIRKDSHASSDKVGVVERGETLIVIQTANNGWGQILTEDGLVGWVNLSYTSDSKPSVGLEGKVIVLDPGHGGHDPGSLGANNKEKDLTLETAKKVKVKLEAAGAKVVMTRTGDTYLTLSERVKISEKNNADVFISIHYNSGSSSASGIETYFWKTNKDESKLAGLVQQEIIKSTGMKDRRTATGNFHVIRENTDSAILVELGFISNPDEEDIIETSDFQNKAATGIANGLLAYFNSF